jgi:hypothetical protein
MWFMTPANASTRDPLGTEDSGAKRIERLELAGTVRTELTS